MDPGYKGETESIICFAAIPEKYIEYHSDKEKELSLHRPELLIFILYFNYMIAAKNRLFL